MKAKSFYPLTPPTSTRSLNRKLAPMIYTERQERRKKFNSLENFKIKQETFSNSLKKPPKERYGSKEEGEEGEEEEEGAALGIIVKLKPGRPSNRLRLSEATVEQLKEELKERTRYQVKHVDEEKLVIPTPIKKGRGRPKKIYTDSESFSTIEDISQATYQNEKDKGITKESDMSKKPLTVKAKPNLMSPPVFEEYSSFATKIKTISQDQTTAVKKKRGRPSMKLIDEEPSYTKIPQVKVTESNDGSFKTFEIKSLSEIQGSQEEEEEEKKEEEEEEDNNEIEVEDEKNLKLIEDLKRKRSRPLHRMKTEEMTVKKPRGRPAKKKSIVITAKERTPNYLKEDKEQERKFNFEELSDVKEDEQDYSEQENNQETQTKRGRGRPKKQTSPKKNEPFQQRSRPTRGRPPKRVQVK